MSVIFEGIELPMSCEYCAMVERTNGKLWGKFPLLFGNPPWPDTDGRRDDCPLRERPTGEWKENAGVFGALSTTDHVEIPAHRCSCCGRISPEPWCKAYCPHCGAYMRGVER